LKKRGFLRPSLFHIHPNVHLSAADRRWKSGRLDTAAPFARAEAAARPSAPRRIEIALLEVFLTPPPVSDSIGFVVLR
jgi:hypothetical protein